MLNSNHSSFPGEITWVSIGLIALLFTGYLFDQPWLFFSIGLFAYIAWHLKQLNKLINWLANSELELPPEARGIWGDIFRHLYRIQRHNRHRHEKLTVMLNRYKEATEAMPDAVVTLKRNWEIEWFNSQGVSFFGLNKSKDIGQPLPNLIRTPALIHFLKNFSGSDTLELISPTDERLNLSIRIIPYGKNQHLLLASDVTRIERLKQVRKDFVANVSHELRTPLTVISGYLETLVECFKDDDHYFASMNLMQQQTKRMCNIVEDLLMLSQIEDRERKMIIGEPVDVPGLMSLLNKEARALSEGKHEIKIECEHDIWLRGENNELRSAFTNLVSNAIRYTPEHGLIQIKWYYRDDKAYFEVEDNGEGIAQHHLDRLTERFYRVDVGRSRSAGGTGLGLSIVKHVLNHHQANLKIESEVGQGSTFICEFPGNMIIRRHVNDALEAVK